MGRANIDKFPDLIIECNGCLARLYGFVDSTVAEVEELVARLSLRMLDARSSTDQAIEIPVLSGNFALIIEAPDAKTTLLIADPLGLRSLYYIETQDGWVWSTKMRMLFPLVEGRSLDLTGVDEFFRYRWLAGENTLISQIKQVQPSHYTFLRDGFPAVTRRYAKLSFCQSGGHDDEAAAIDETNSALDSYFTKMRRRSDAVGIFFSGGVDSSLLVAKAREHDFRRLVTVTVRWPGRPNPEAERAARIAKHFNVEHRVVDVSDEFIETALPGLIWQLERPPRHANGFAIARMFSAICDDVEIAITGEAADRLYGTSSLLNIARYAARQDALGKMPLFIRHALVKMLPLFPMGKARNLLYALTNDTQSHILNQSSFEPLTDARALSSLDAMPSLTNVRPQKFDKRYEYMSPTPLSMSAFQSNLRLYGANRAHCLEYSAMAELHHMQVGFPFLSAEVMDIGLNLHESLKNDARGPKPVIKKLACRYMPEEWVYEDKLGFETPLVDWLNGPLRKYLTLLYADNGAKGFRGLLDQEVIAKMDLRQDQDLLWTAMTLEIFIRQFIDLDPDFAPVRI